MIILILYGLHPFINGSGCDFQSQTIDSERERYTTCRFGIINVVERDKTSDIHDHVTYQGMYGVTGGRSLIFVYKISDPGDGAKLLANNYFLQSRIIYISNNIVADTTDWVMVKAPFYQIYKNKRVGRLSWW